MDDAWISDDSDIEIDEADPPLSVFDGLKKGFLLEKPSKRKSRAPTPQPPPHQSEPPPRTQNAPKTQVNRTLREEILQELGHLQGEYGPASGEGTSPIPYEEISGFFFRVERWLLQTCQESESHAFERVEKAAKRIEEAADKLQNARPTVSYAQAARWGSARATPGQDTPPRAHPKEEKSVIIKITDKDEAKNIKNQSRKDIAHRIQHAAGGAQAAHTVLAVRQLKSGDLAVHMDSAAGKKEMEEKKEWAKAIAPSAETRKKTWPVMVHGVKVADHPLSAWEKHAKHIVKENAKLHPDLQIRGLRWFTRTEGKEFSTLIIEADSAEHANRMISEGVVTGYDLKIAERYDSKCRVIQCFKCQKYGHISSVCLNEQKCGFCGEGHSTDLCADKTQAIRKKCAGCNGENHTSWSKDCPARVKELGRARAAKLALSRLFPVATITQFFTKPFKTPQAEGMRPAGASQAESMRPSGASQSNEDASDAPKKRKLNPIGRPIGAVNKAKALGGLTSANNSILNFNFTSSQAQPASGPQNAGETPAINDNKQTNDSIINGEMSDICGS
jgi:hypothetical protein